MKQIIIFLFKSNLTFFVLCLLFCFFSIEFSGIWKIIPYIFLLFFFYDWNVSSKLNKTWAYLDTLPISLFKRYFLRVIIPFTFSFLVFVCLEVFQQQDQKTVLSTYFHYFTINEPVNVLKVVTDSLRQTCVFVLSSILAAGLGSYILYIILFHFILLNISHYNLYMVFVLTFVFCYSYYSLSRKRISAAKFLYVPLVVSIIVVMIANFFQSSFYKGLLSIPVSSFQTIVAKTLIQKNAFIIKQDYTFGFLNMVTTVRFDEPLLFKIEDVVVKGRYCSKLCFQLADVVQGFPQNWNYDKLASDLNSQEESRQIYALEILRAAQSIVFFNRILQLSGSENGDVANLSTQILNQWGISSPRDIPRTETF